MQNAKQKGLWCEGSYEADSCFDSVLYEASGSRVLMVHLAVTADSWDSVWKARFVSVAMRRSGEEAVRGTENL